MSVIKELKSPFPYNEMVHVDKEFQLEFTEFLQLVKRTKDKNDFGRCSILGELEDLAGNAGEKDESMGLAKIDDGNDDDNERDDGKEDDGNGMPLEDKNGKK